MFKNAKDQKGLLQLKPNTVVKVTARNPPFKEGGFVHITLKKNGSNLAQLCSLEAIQCTTLVLDLPSSSCYVWLLFLLYYCYPFMKKLVLTSAVHRDRLCVVQYPFFFMCVERLLRFNNLPSLEEISVSCRGDQQNKR